MGNRVPTPPTRPNRLLALLPRDDADRLTGRMDLVRFGVRDVVYPAGKRVEHVYFPVAGVFSLVVVMADGAAVEVGTVGSEGMLGLSAYLGSNHSPNQTFCQVVGAAYRLPVDVFREECSRDGALADLARRFAQAQLVFAAQSTACGRLHSVDERCARWLLMTHDRVGADTFQLTQEFLALMLGVRRASVTVAAGMLQRAGMIDYTRGKITVTDRGRLEAAACECYRMANAELDALLTPPRGDAEPPDPPPG